eukprot:m.226429 g.226429  ORF g.226429 m.226429 type:complete len:1065 (-) comp17311_c0_seq73:1767-4961(-)
MSVKAREPGLKRRAMARAKAIGPSHNGLLNSEAQMEEASSLTTSKKAKRSRHGTVGKTPVRTVEVGDLSGNAFARQQQRRGLAGDIPVLSFDTTESPTVDDNTDDDNDEDIDSVTFLSAVRALFHRKASKPRSAQARFCVGCSVRIDSQVAKKRRLRMDSELVRGLGRLISQSWPTEGEGYVCRVCVVYAMADALDTHLLSSDAQDDGGDPAISSIASCMKKPPAKIDSSPLRTMHPVVFKMFPSTAAISHVAESIRSTLLHLLATPSTTALVLMRTITRVYPLIAARCCADLVHREADGRQASIDPTLPSAELADALDLRKIKDRMAGTRPVAYVLAAALKNTPRPNSIDTYWDPTINILLEDGARNPKYNAGQCIITTLLRAHHVSVECISALASLAIAMPLQTMYTFEKKTASAMSCFLCPRACSSPFVVAAYDNINVSAGKSVVRESGRRSKDDFNGMIASIRGSNYSVTDFQQPLPMCLERDSSRIMSLSELLTPPPAASRRLEEAVVQTILSRAQGMFGLSLDQDDFRSAFDHVFHPSHHHALNHPQPFTMFLTDLDETNKVDHVEMLSLIEAGAVKLGIQLGILEAAPTHLNARDEADDPAHAAAALLRKGNPPPGSETHLQRSHHAISPLRTYRIALSGDELTIRLLFSIAMMAAPQRRWELVPAAYGFACFGDLHLRFESVQIGFRLVGTREYARFSGTLANIALGLGLTPLLENFSPTKFRQARGLFAIYARQALAVLMAVKVGVNLVGGVYVMDAQAMDQLTDVERRALVYAIVADSCLLPLLASQRFAAHEVAAHVAWLQGYVHRRNVQVPHLEGEQAEMQRRSTWLIEFREWKQVHEPALADKSRPRRYLETVVALWALMETLEEATRQGDGTTIACLKMFLSGVCDRLGLKHYAFVAVHETKMVRNAMTREEAWRFLQDRFVVTEAGSILAEDEWVEHLVRLSKSFPSSMYHRPEQFAKLSAHIRSIPFMQHFKGTFKRNCSSANDSFRNLDNVTVDIQQLFALYHSTDPSFPSLPTTLERDARGTARLNGKLVKSRQLDNECDSWRCPF